MTDSPEVIRLRARVVALRQNRLLVRYATNFAITAIVIDHIYTTIWWLMLGRNERRTKRYPALRYFLVIAQLSAETAAVLHLLSLSKSAAKGGDEDASIQTAA